MKYIVNVHTTYFSVHTAVCANLEEVRQYCDDWKNDADHFDFYLETENSRKRIIPPIDL